MRETWFVLEDGSRVHPNEVSPDKKTGKLVHKSGVAVAMKGDVPHSYGVDPEEERAKGKKKGRPEADPAEAAAAAAAAAEQERAQAAAEQERVRTTARDMKAESPRRPYNTRDQKAE